MVGQKSVKQTGDLSCRRSCEKGHLAMDYVVRRRGVIVGVIVSVVKIHPACVEPRGAEPLECTLRRRVSWSALLSHNRTARLT